MVVLPVIGSRLTGLGCVARPLLVKDGLGGSVVLLHFFFFQAEDGIRDYKVTGVQTCALPISVDHGGGTPRQYRSALRHRLRHHHRVSGVRSSVRSSRHRRAALHTAGHGAAQGRSEEHTSELQSPCNLVCRLLLEKKKKDMYEH